MVEAGRTELRVDVAGLAPDVATVDALARLHLAARRVGRRLRLVDASPELLELIALCGLTNALSATNGVD